MSMRCKRLVNNWSLPLEPNRFASDIGISVLPRKVPQGRAKGYPLSPYQEVFHLYNPNLAPGSR
jgi:hypothetical protein